MKFWLNVAWVEPEQLLEVARYAEDAGFYGVMNAEHLFVTSNSESRYPYRGDGKYEHSLDHEFPDVWTSFAAMAAVTERLYFSSCVYLLPLRNPIDVAKQAGTVARLSGNRVSIGFGVGWQKDEFDAMGVDFHTRGKRTDEMIDVMRKLWVGDDVSHQGQFFEFTDIKLRPTPSEPVPFYGGGTSDAALRRAAQRCDGFIGVGRPLEDIPALVETLSAIRRESSHANRPFEIFEHIRPKDPYRPAGDYQRLRDIGVTGTVLPPFAVGATEPYATIDDKKRMIDRYASTILCKM